jgi:hypothetical protein
MDQRDEVSGKVLGTPFSIKGSGALIIVVLAVALFYIIYLVMETSREIADRHAEAMQIMAERTTKEHDALVDVLHSLKTVNENISKAIDEQSFIILASEKEQASMKMRLRMPDSLRIKLLENGR